jgi:hypothetical protein
MTDFIRRRDPMSFGRSDMMPFEKAANSAIRGCEEPIEWPEPISISAVGLSASAWGPCASCGVSLPDCTCGNPRFA